MSEKLWCEMCGKWSDHRSGGCPTATSAQAAVENRGAPKLVGSVEGLGIAGPYAVACVLTSCGWAGTKTVLSHAIVTAASEDEARGIATRNALEANKDYSLILVSVMTASPNKTVSERSLENSTGGAGIS